MTQAGVSRPCTLRECVFSSIGPYLPSDTSYLTETNSTWWGKTVTPKAHQRMLLLPVFAKTCLLLGCSVLASLPTLAGAGRIARMGLAAASKEGLGLGLLFTSCPLCVAAEASILKEKELQLERKPHGSPLSLNFCLFPLLAQQSQLLLS